MVCPIQLSAQCGIGFLLEYMHVILDLGAAMALYGIFWPNVHVAMGGIGWCNPKMLEYTSLEQSHLLAFDTAW